MATPDAAEVRRTRGRKRFAGVPNLPRLWDQAKNGDRGLGACIGWLSQLLRARALSHVRAADIYGPIVSRDRNDRRHQGEPRTTSQFGD
jgi:hypothetical protein